MKHVFEKSFLFLVDMLLPLLWGCKVINFAAHCSKTLSEEMDNGFDASLYEEETK